MKLAISTSGKDLNAPLTGFGRARHFILYDTETQNYETLSNEKNMAASKGAGARTAQEIKKAGAEAIISAKIGPKALSYLQGKNIPSFVAEQATVREAIDAYMNAELQPS